MPGTRTTCVAICLVVQTKLVSTTTSHARLGKALSAHADKILTLTMNILFMGFEILLLLYSMPYISAHCGFDGGPGNQKPYYID